MNLTKLGQGLRRNPSLRTLPIDDELLAEILLEMADFGTVQKLREIAKRPRRSSKWFEGNRLDNEAKMIANDLAEIGLVHQIDLVFDASRKGVPVTALHDMALERNRAEVEMMVDDHALDSIERYHLQNHSLIERLNVRVNELVDKHDAEVHPLKKKALFIRIKNLLEELDARARVAALQAGYGEGLERSNEPPQDGANSREGAEAGLHEIPTERDRIGFGRPSVPDGGRPGEPHSHVRGSRNWEK